MHEWILAEGVLRAVRVISKPPHKFRVRIGELRQVNLEIFRHALRELSKGTELEGMEVEIEVERASIKCEDCGYEFGLDQMPLSEGEKECIHFFPSTLRSFGCPRCRSVRLRISGGREFEVEPA